MPVCRLPLLLVQLVLIIPLNGAVTDEVQHKGRRWSRGGDGPYSLVVSADDSTVELIPQETVGYALALQDKKAGKTKNGDETTGKTMDKYDKATERLTMKETRKRLAVNSETTSTRKRRRHPAVVSSTTGLPQTMSYNLYNHFRPLEQDVPQDHILPFLDFGRKLSTGVYNSIEASSSTPRIATTTTTTTTTFPPYEEVRHDDMDVAVVKSAVERNFPPRRSHNRQNLTEFFTDKILDLQPNESGRKIQIVLSPNYGLRLNKTEHNESTTTERKNISTTTEKTTVATTAVEKDDDVKNDEATSPVNSSQLASSNESLEPSPTARILSTAVVTSVSVKESPRFPRIRANSSEINHRINPMKSDVHLHHSTIYNDHNRTSIWHNSSRRKFTTFRPKTTTLRPVTFRSAFRRNSSQLPVVVHVVSTPPSYIEVPRISPVSRTRTTFQPVESTTNTVQLTSLNTSTVSTETTSTVNSSTVDTVMDYTTTTTSSTERPSITTTKIETTTPSPKTEPQEFNTVLPTNPPIAAVEIEFRPLNDHMPHQPELLPKTTPKPLTTLSTTTRPYNFTVPLIPDLLWVYGQRNNHSVKTQPSTVDLAFHETTWGIATYVLVALGMVPLLLGAVVLVRHILLHSKKKVLDESEYSSEYNRSPLPTKLPRLPSHIQSWEETKPTPPSPPLPSSAGTKWEFPRDKLRLQTVLGQGNFGQVWKAEADDISGHEGLTRLVAVKTVKEGSSLREKEDLLRELAIMQELGAHPNVVTLLGCCAEKEPNLLIMEYVMYGKLLAFLREHRTRAHYFNFSDLSSALNSRDLTVFSYCVARGMEYLVSKGIIHRDLAARNILVDHNKLCKIADFGMSRNVRDTGEIYEQRPNRGALPIRWMAPESLHYNLFTHKSDVWSFGVLLWEIVTLGSTPYSTMGAREVMRQVVDGYRLEKPKHCKAEFFKVLSKCWINDPKKRPSFSELKAEIGTLLGTSETEGRFVDLEAMAEDIIDQGH